MRTLTLTLMLLLPLAPWTGSTADADEPSLEQRIAALPNLAARDRLARRLVSVDQDDGDARAAIEKELLAAEEADNAPRIAALDSKAERAIERWRARRRLYAVTGETDRLAREAETLAMSLGRRSGLPAVRAPYVVLPEDPTPPAWNDDAARAMTAALIVRASAIATADYSSTAARLDALQGLLAARRLPDADVPGELLREALEALLSTREGDGLLPGDDADTRVEQSARAALAALAVAGHRSGKEDAKAVGKRHEAAQEQARALLERVGALPVARPDALACIGRLRVTMARNRRDALVATALADWHRLIAPQQHFAGSWTDPADARTAVAAHLLRDLLALEQWVDFRHPLSPRLRDDIRRAAYRLIRRVEDGSADDPGHALAALSVFERRARSRREWGYLRARAAAATDAVAAALLPLARQSVDPSARLPLEAWARYLHSRRDRSGVDRPQRDRTPAKAKSPSEVVVDPKAYVPDDGDSFMLGDVDIRLAGCDTPEIKHPEHGFFVDQPRGREAAAFTEKLMRAAKDIRYLPLSKDRYGRTLAHVLVDGKPLAVQLIEAGLAYETITRYGDGGTPGIAWLIQDAARRAGKPTFQDPALWRRANRRQPRK